MVEQIVILAPIFISSLIAASLIVLGGSTMNQDGSRRWIYLIGGLIAALAAAVSGLTALKFVEIDDSSGLFLLALLLLFIAPFLIWFGIRGRRVGDHPYCRRCGFDLFGRSKNTTQCSECGANLNARRAMVIGERRRRPIPIFVGLILLLVGIGTGLPTAMAVIEDQNLQGLKPDWLLALQFNPSVHPYSTGIPSLEHEIRERMENEKLSSHAVKSIAHRCAKAIKDGKAVHDWPDHVFSQSPRVWFDDETLRTLVRHQLEPEFQITNPVVMGDPISYRAYLLSLSRSIMKKSIDHSAQYSAKPVRDWVNGVDLGRMNIKTTNFVLRGSTIFPRTFLDLGPHWEVIESSDNGQEVEITWEREIEITVEIKDGDRKFTDRWTTRVKSSAKVLDSSNSVAKTEPSNELDRALTWSAQLHIADDRAWLQLKHDGESDKRIHTVLARAILIGEDAELDAGLCYNDMFFQLFSANEIPSGKLRVELRPAPEMRWMFSPSDPILGDVIYIESVERVIEENWRPNIFSLAQF